MSAILSASSERDIRGILRQTFHIFGPRQVLTHSRLIERAIDLVAEDPVRLGSVDCSSIARDVRLFYLALASERRDGASHHLYYLHRPVLEDVIILRILHQKMEPKARLGRALASVTNTSGPDAPRC